MPRFENELSTKFDAFCSVATGADTRILKWQLTINWFSLAMSFNNRSMSSTHRSLAGSGMPLCFFFLASSFRKVAPWLGISMTWLNKMASQSGTLKRKDKKSTGKPRILSLSFSSICVLTCCGRSILSILITLMLRNAFSPILISLSVGAILFRLRCVLLKSMQRICMTSRLIRASFRTTADGNRSSTFPIACLNSRSPLASYT